VHTEVVVERRILLELEVCVISFGSLNVVFVVRVFRAELFEEVSVFGFSLSSDFVLEQQRGES